MIEAGADAVVPRRPAVFGRAGARTGLGAEDNKTVTLSRNVKSWVVAIGGITVAAFVVSGWLSGGFRGSDALSGLFVSFLYTITIGSMVSFAMERLWPRMTGLGQTVMWLARISLLLAAIALGTLAALAVLWNLDIVRGRSFWRTYLFNLQFAAFITLTFGMMLMIYEYWRAKYERSELERERALKLATEARLASLESRIHPHFLFNTLNSISSLIHSDPMAADAQLQRLCALLRFSLDATETPLVTLGQELRIVRDYLEIEKTRFGDRLRFAVDVPEPLLALAVPPLAIQTLVENSVKHVIAPSRGGGEVRVAATLADGRLTITVADGGPGVTAAPLPAGHGLDNLRSRLQVLFGDRAGLAFAPAAVRMDVPA